MRKSIVLSLLWLGAGAVQADGGVPVQWMERGRMVTGWQDSAVVAMTVAPGQAVPQRPDATFLSQSGNLVLYALTGAAPTAPGALAIVRLSASGSGPYQIASSGVIVKGTDPAGLERALAGRGLKWTALPVPGYLAVSVPEGQSTLGLAAALAQISGVTESAPDWYRPIGPH